MKKKKGITLIELIMFIAIMSIVALTILLPFNSSFIGIPSAHQANVLTKSAVQCVEWFLGQRSTHGFHNVTCPSSTVPTFCAVPPGYSIAVSATCQDANTTDVVVTTSNGSLYANLAVRLKNY